MIRTHRYGLGLALLLAACSGDAPTDAGPDAAADAGLDVVADAGADADALDTPDGSGGGVFYESVRVTVTLDGAPIEGAIVLQGGTSVHFETGPDGVVDVPIDPNVVGTLTLVGSHPEARIKPVDLDELAGPEATIALVRYDTSDNLDYAFQDPGEPRRRPNTGQCSHCHQTIGDTWFNSPHRTPASNPYVHDWFAGATHTARSDAECSARGGVWLPGLEPGTGEAIERCYVGDGALPTRSNNANASSRWRTRSSKTGGTACSRPRAPSACGSTSSRPTS